MGSTGPGTELKKLFEKLGVRQKPNCSCKLLQDAMDDLGPRGCREKMGTILHLLEKNQKLYTITDWMIAGTLAVARGIVFKLDLTDPMFSLVKMAIKNAEELDYCQRFLGSME